MPWPYRRATPAGDGTGRTSQSGEPKKRPAAPVGYLLKRKDGLTGEPGIGYNYVMAEDGLYVQSESSHIQACIPIATTKIKGLHKLERRIHLVHGPIPRGIFTAGLHWFRETPETERFFAVLWEGEKYRINVPKQDGTESRLKYEPPGPGVVMEIHSHGTHSAFFSNTDDQDEQAFRIYGVMEKWEQKSHRQS